MKTKTLLFGGCIIAAGLVNHASADFVYAYAYGYAYSYENGTYAYDSWFWAGGSPSHSETINLPTVIGQFDMGPNSMSTSLTLDTNRKRKVVNADSYFRADFGIIGSNMPMVFTFSGGGIFVTIDNYTIGTYQTFYSTFEYEFIENNVYEVDIYLNNVNKSVTVTENTNTCPADISGDGHVNVTDLLSVIDGWGSSNSPADVNNDGTVDVSDLLAIVDAWGPCD
jgi:hypothetical protein